MNRNTVQGIVYCIILYTFKGIKTSTLTKQVSILVKKGEHLELHCLRHAQEWVKRENFILLVDCNANTVKVNPFYDMKLIVENQCQDLIIVNVSRSDGGIYQCSYDNSIYKFNVAVTYPPSVAEQDIVFHVGDMNKNITCQVDGFPLKYVFKEWMHLSYDFEEIRALTGSKDGTLFLPNQDKQSISYYDAGLYVCNVSNSISDENGEIWQTGMVNVSVKGAPFFVRANDVEHICLNSPTWYIEINVLSAPRLTMAAWDKHHYDPQSEDRKPCLPSTVKTHVYGNVINATGYKCSLGIPVSAMLAHYTLTVANSLGITTAVFTPRFEDGSRMLNDPDARRFYLDVLTTLSNGEKTEHQDNFTIEYKINKQDMCKTDLEISFPTPGFDASVLIIFSACACLVGICTTLIVGLIVVKCGKIRNHTVESNVTVHNTTENENHLYDEIDETNIDTTDGSERNLYLIVVNENTQPSSEL